MFKKIYSSFKYLGKSFVNKLLKVDEEEGIGLSIKGLIRYFNIPVIFSKWN